MLVVNKRLLNKREEGEIAGLTLRYRAGDDAIELLDQRKALDDKTFIDGLKAQLNLA